MLTITLVLVLLALGTTIASAMNKCPLFVPVLILCVMHLLAVLPR